MGKSLFLLLAIVLLAVTAFLVGWYLAVDDSCCSALSGCRDRLLWYEGVDLDGNGFVDVYSNWSLELEKS